MEKEKKQQKLVELMNGFESVVATLGQNEPKSLDDVTEKLMRLNSAFFAVFAEWQIMLTNEQMKHIKMVILVQKVFTVKTTGSLDLISTDEKTGSMKFTEMVENRSTTADASTQIQLEFGDEALNKVLQKPGEAQKAVVTMPQLKKAMQKAQVDDWDDKPSRNIEILTYKEQYELLKPFMKLKKQHTLDANSIETWHNNAYCQCVGS